MGDSEYAPVIYISFFNFPLLPEQNDQDILHREK